VIGAQVRISGASQNCWVLNLGPLIYTVNTVHLPPALAEPIPISDKDDIKLLLDDYSGKELNALD
jgi:hypothetical protein